ncbi:hypothetical protein M2404_001230 [Rheinheimera pacifica]|uniref:hypothetical protein n=1 Tax=Rheinheimera pacifica TaxID=173990 RepID=UPI0021682F54|nr:hypothetical protein [Rheinheimera pacifica]MCS4306905.1 hypothetical protein [Rheinheimera pacifica]
MSCLLEQYALSEYFLRVRISELRGTRTAQLSNTKVLEIEKLEKEIKRIAVKKELASNLSTKFDIEY